MGIDAVSEIQWSPERSSIEGNGEVQWNYCKNMGVEIRWAESYRGGSAMEIGLKGIGPNMYTRIR
jgi:hypothetical protein